MTPSAPVSFDDLQSAYEWISCSEPGANFAMISRATGEIRWRSENEGLEDVIPDGMIDESLYVAVPHKYDLDLGNRLALDFGEQHLPESFRMIRGFFKRSGAYSRFKAVLDEHGLLETWYRYEEESTEKALREWCEENGVTIAT